MAAKVGDYVYKLRCVAEDSVREYSQAPKGETKAQQQVRLMHLENWRGRYAAYDYALQLIQEDEREG